MLTPTVKVLIFTCIFVLLGCSGTSTRDDGDSSENTDETSTTLNTSSEVRVSENDDELVIQFNLNQSSDTDVHFDYATQANSANDSDYLPVSGRFTIAAGETSGSLTVQIQADTISESEEEFRLILSNPDGIELNTTTVTITIIDDDSPPTNSPPTMSVNNHSFSEGNTGNTEAQFVITLSAASPQDISVDITSEDVSAQAGSDYIAVNNTITIPSGDTSASFSVTIIGDTNTETDEVFNLLLSNPVNAVIGTNTIVATINNDDTNVGTIPIDNPDWRDGVLPAVSPIEDNDVVRTSGNYRLIELPNDGHRFWLVVPNSYDESKPAGLMVFVHGHYNGQDDINQWFHNWWGAFGDANLIWIKMSFRDNAGPTQRHMDSIRHAIAKTAATYKIILGHGVLTGFSRGATAMSYWVNQHQGWPFNHVLSESGRYETSLPTTLSPMSWTFAVGQNEWNSFNLGNSASTTMENLAGRLGSNGSMDIHLHVIDDEGHTVSLHPSVIDPTKAAYQRSRIFRAPFVYRPDFAEPELTNIVNSSQALKLGNAIRHAQALLDSSPNTNLTDKANQLAELINERVDEMYTMLTQLAISDPVLAEHYAIVASQQLSGHPRENEFSQLLLSLLEDNDFSAQKAASLKWYDEFLNYLVPGTATLDSNSVGTVQDISNTLPSSSVVGTMAEEFLLLQ